MLTPQNCTGDKFKWVPKWIEYILLFPCGNICVSVHQQPWPGHPFKCNYSAAHARLATREARALKGSFVSASLQIDLPYYCWECYGKFKVTRAIFRHGDYLKCLESGCFACYCYGLSNQGLVWVVCVTVFESYWSICFACWNDETLRELWQTVFKYLKNTFKGIVCPKITK